MQTLRAEDKAPDQPTIGPRDAREPFSRFSSTDRVGLAFSGGGIRSATFNLGLLKSLDELDVLRHVDYVSTVSGGGYIASWWTAWRTRLAASAAIRFPQVAGTDQVSEPPEVLHLRRFSNFLVPRLGFFEVEFWNGVLAVLSSFLPSILIATSVLMISMWFWLLLALMLQGFSTYWSIESLVAVTGFVLAGMEWWWQNTTGPGNPNANKNYWGSVIVVLALLATIGLLFEGARIIPHSHLTLNKFPLATFDSIADVRHLLCRFFDAMTDISRTWRLYGPSAVWIAVTLIVIVCRTLWFGIMRYSHNGDKVSQLSVDLDLAVRRILDRLVALAAVWAIAATIWILALHLKGGLPHVVAGSGAAAALFAALRDWFPRAATRQAGWHHQKNLGFRSAAASIFGNRPGARGRLPIDSTRHHDEV